MPELPPFHNPPPRSDGVPEEASDQPSASATPAPPVAAPDKPDRWRRPRSLIAWLIRWALLGGGVCGAWLVGVLVAQFAPASDPAPPVQEILVRRTQQVVQKVRRFPAWWSGDDRRPGGSAAVLPGSLPETAPSLVAPPPDLSADQRDQVMAELEALQTEVQQLRDRTSALEQQLEIPPLEQSLERRLGTVANRLNPPEIAAQPTPETPSEGTPDPPESAPATGRPAPDPLFEIDAYRVTLPSDVLFVPGDGALQANAEPLLDSILLDIGQYPGATILVSSHTDIEADEMTPTELSYQQALAVQRYLSQRLGETPYHWVTVGYGTTELGGPGGRPLNRRLAIAIVP